MYAFAIFFYYTLICYSTQESCWKLQAMILQRNITINFNRTTSMLLINKD